MSLTFLKKENLYNLRKDRLVKKIAICILFSSRVFISMIRGEEYITWPRKKRNVISGEENLGKETETNRKEEQIRAWNVFKSRAIYRRDRLRRTLIARRRKWRRARTALIANGIRSKGSRRPCLVQFLFFQNKILGPPETDFKLLARSRFASRMYVRTLEDRKKLHKIIKENGIVSGRNTGIESRFDIYARQSSVKWYFGRWRRSKIIGGRKWNGRGPIIRGGS